MLTNRTLARINNRPREVRRLPLLAVGGVTLVVSALLYVFGILPPLAILALAGSGALLVLLLYVTLKRKTTIPLSYKGNLNEQKSGRFSEIQGSLEDLASSEGLWRMTESGRLPKASQVLQAPERVAAKVGQLPTPGIKADVPIWGIEAGEGTLYFFPEGALYYTNNRYTPVSYESLKMSLSSGRFFEEEDLPEDATVVDHIWRYSKPDGSPDSRYRADNVEIPVLLYNVVEVKGSFGLELRLIVSNRKAAARFARVFDARDLREKKRKDTGEKAKKSASPNSHEEKPRSMEEIERDAKLATARKTLGVAKGASAEQIGAAYRKLALAHHPDKVVSLQPEAREYSEERMKEINLAYAELRGKGGSVAREARPA